MSSFSRSRSKGHYPNHSHGGEYYKRSHGSGGILGKIFEALTGSKSHSRSYSNHHDAHHSNHNDGYHRDHNNRHYSGRHRRKSSWS